MPRMSEAEKQKSHARILDAAAALLREKGVEATSVGDVMSAAGMTHGGFYRHFDSKETLVAEAFQHAVDGIVGDMEAAANEPERKPLRKAYVEQYLSRQHVENRGIGCPLATLGAGLARVEGVARHTASDTVTRLAGLLDEPESEAQAKGRALLALLVGSVVLARLADDNDDVDKMLAAGQTGVALLQSRWEE